MPTPKACSGKCKGGACGKAQRVWVVAACEGMISLFEKDREGDIAANSFAEHSVFSSPSQFQQFINDAKSNNAFEQLVIVGSTNDIAWVHSLLLQHIAPYITAEIKYPLMASWFKEPYPMAHLTRALKNIFAY